jgi:acetyl-CoA carboxylase biotin carboxylase subunit
MSQEDVRLQGFAMLCRVRAEDPWSHFMASPGHVWRVRFPSGHGIRVDSYLYGGVDIPPAYDPLVANVCVWASDRESCVNRMRRALEDVKIVGTATNMSTLQHVLRSRELMQGVYNTDFLTRSVDTPPQLETYYRDLAVIAAVLFQRRNESYSPVIPQRMTSGWHLGSRRRSH